MKIKLKLKLKPKENEEEEKKSINSPDSQKCSTSSSSAKRRPPPSAAYDPDPVPSWSPTGTSYAISSGSIWTDSAMEQHENYVFYAPAAKRRPGFSSAHLRDRADAILGILSSQGCASEVKIRELLGDSPSTSKALRLLLNLEQVKRSGAGGRNDPYIYMIT